MQGEVDFQLAVVTKQLDTSLVLDRCKHKTVRRLCTVFAISMYQKGILCRAAANESILFARQCEHRRDDTEDVAEAGRR